MDWPVRSTGIRISMYVIPEAFKAFNAFKTLKAYKPFNAFKALKTFKALKPLMPSILQCLRLFNAEGRTSSYASLFIQDELHKTSNNSVKSSPNSTFRDSFGILRTCRFWNCHWFSYLTKIWRSYWGFFRRQLKFPLLYKGFFKIPSFDPSSVFLMVLNPPSGVENSNVKNSPLSYIKSCVLTCRLLIWPSFVV